MVEAGVAVCLVGSDAVCAGKECDEVGVKIVFWGILLCTDFTTLRRGAILVNLNGLARSDAMEMHSQC
jgi:hypothetical protein